MSSSQNNLLSLSLSHFRRSLFAGYDLAAVFNNGIKPITEPVRNPIILREEERSVHVLELKLKQSFCLHVYFYYTSTTLRYVLLLLLLFWHHSFVCLTVTNERLKLVCKELSNLFFGKLGYKRFFTFSCLLIIKFKL